MHQEMEAHLAHTAERLEARGMSPEAARLAARREFGNVGVLQEEGRDARGTQWMESLAGDVRFAVRHFTRRSLFAVTIVLVLALGIGGHAAVFSMVQAYTTRPAPGVPRDDALVHVRGKERYPSGRWMPRYFSYPEWREIATVDESFAAVAGWIAHDGAVDAGKTGEAALARINFVTDSYFATLGVRLALGPGLPVARDLEQPELVAVIGHALWRDAFGGRGDVIGKTIRVNDVDVRIVGVAPVHFNGALQTTGTRVVWLPLSARATLVRSSSRALASRDSML
ncbi:MAG TPA: ABC transporter permease, partial [Gemmatimonadaceae bacterium]